MLVYHGSNLIVDHPRLVSQNRFLDFDFGFYTTTNKEQAIGFASKVVLRERAGEPLVSVYEIDDTKIGSLSSLRFDAPNEEWLDFVSESRAGVCKGEQYDLICGPVADDNVYRTITFYMSGDLTRSQALEALKIRKLYDQYVWATEIALSCISFVDGFSTLEVE